MISPRTRGGFTLLEVLVATLIFFVATVGITRIVRDGLRGLTNVKEEQRANRLGEQMLREMLAQAQAGTLPAIGTREGAFDGEDSDMRWVLEVTPYTVKVRAAPDAPATPPPQAGSDSQPPLRQAVLRVFASTSSAERARPFVAFLAEQSESVGEGEDEGTQDQQQNEAPIDDDSQAQSFSE